MSEKIRPSAELLKHVRLLAAFEERELEKLVQLGSSRHYEPHTNIVIEGELSWGIYFILAGKVRVFKRNRMTGESHDVGQLEQGSFFGEMSLVDHQPRSASVKSLTESHVFFIDKKDFQKYLDDSDERKIRFYESCLQSIVNRLRETDENYVISQYQLWKRALKKEAA